MKSKGKNLERAYAQAKDYAFHLEDEELPEYIMVCDFERIRLYRLTTGQKWEFQISQLHKHVKKFSELAGYKASDILPTDKEVDIKAAEKMAKLHDILKGHGYEGHHLEVYLVRLLFCMFADDSGIFEKNIFFDYISASKEDGSDLSYRIAKLFEVLNMSYEERRKRSMLSEELLRFEYINGSLFTEPLPLADFDFKMRKMLLECCTLNWTYISPAIFGSIFQGVMDPEERRSLGAHYTSEENILKVIGPLFLDELWEEFERVKTNSKQLEYFHEKLSKLRFLDPACGCGNFLIITYRELRKLELEVLKMKHDDARQATMIVDQSGIESRIDVDQFFGIEIEEFPAQIAQVGMWLMDHQMNTLLAEHFGLYYARLPLSKSATIINANALRVDWTDIISATELNYILGNPPFLGGMTMSRVQKEEMTELLVGINGVGELDYVAAWYFIAGKVISNTNIRCAFVSTNSIIQGQQAVTLWKPLLQKYDLKIDFGYRTFVWSNQAKGKAAVHCVIVGFSHRSVPTNKAIYDKDKIIESQNINSYLVNGPNIFVESRSNPLCNVPKMKFGSMPRDGGNFVLTDEERIELIRSEPLSEKWIKPYLGAYEFINNKIRWCLWLVDADPSELRSCPKVMERVERVKEFRLNSKAAGTRKFAETPTLFCQIAQPDTPYLLVPKVSSERRNYVPLGFMEPDTIASDLVFVIPDATLYHFGVLTSSIHMAWLRAVAGRLKSDYRYSKDIVYNTFPWPEPTQEKQSAIESAAQDILDVRNKYYDNSLAELYDPLTMPPELIKAHNQLDRQVKRAYGNKGFSTEAERVADLFQRYQELSNERSSQD